MDKTAYFDILKSIHTRLADSKMACVHCGKARYRVEMGKALGFEEPCKAAQGVTSFSHTYAKRQGG